VIPAASGRVDLLLYVNGVTEVSSGVKQAVYLQLDSALGEYDVETHVGEIDIRPASAASAETQPFRDLPTVVDGVK
jgi:hypothetical protein